MARLFNLALEEVVEEAGLVASSEPQEEIEAIENAESAGATEAEIDNGVSEVDQALEEADKLQEQINVNEEVLDESEPVADAAVSSVDDDVNGGVTEEQVVEANESLKYALAFLGSPELYVRQVKVSSENARTMSLRQQLRIANEDAKEVLYKIIETAKRLIAQFVAKAVVWVKQIILKLGNYGKAIDGITKELAGVKADDIDAAKVKEKLAKVGTAEVNYAIIKGYAFAYNMPTNVGVTRLKDTLAAIANGKNPAELKTELQTYDVSIYGFKDIDGAVVGLTGKSALVLADKGYKKVSLEDNDEVEKATIDIQALLYSVTSNAGEVKKFVTGANTNIKAIQNIQTSCQAELNKLKSAGAENKDKVARQVEAAKSVAIVGCMFRINEYIGAIKGFVKVGQTLVNNKKDGGKTEKKK